MKKRSRRNQPSLPEKRVRMKIRRTEPEAVRKTNRTKKSRLRRIATN